MKEVTGRGTGVEEAGEDAQERSAREVVELLQELRVVLPGVQVLFAFLLTVPFTQRFAQLTGTAAATALLIAPSAHHRLLWRRGAREERLQVGNLLTILGLVFLVPAMVGVIFVITDLMFGSPTAVGVTVAMAASFVLLWFLLPLRYR
jgi:Family of unknown function (DUF6328)